MKFLYTLLFCLSITLINPWGLSRGEIWTQPKVLVLLLICLVNLLILWSERIALNTPQSWKISKLLWELFLGIGLLSTLQSPFPLRSLFGQEQMGDGWLYWLLISVFTLSNTLLLRLHPELIPSQLNGLLIGGVIVALGIFPQVIDWRIDYTATMGQLLKSNVLASTIFQAHQPIGLYSHRGHASFVLAAVGVLSLVSWQWRWLSTRLTAAILIPIVAALLFTQTRAGVLALIMALAYWFYQSSLAKRYRKFLICTVLVSVLFVSAVSANRKIEALEQFNFDRTTLGIKNLSSDRAVLWQQSLCGISKRPLLGWGFDGFGIAYPYILNSEWTPKVVRLGNFSFDYQSGDGELRTKPLPTYKAHNLILDTTNSVGILGMLSYLALLSLSLYRLIKSPCRGIEAVAIAYLVFTFTWFECAQFTHLAWWALSISGVNPTALSSSL